MKLSREDRNALIREGHKFKRHSWTRDRLEVADHLFGILIDREDLAEYEAVEISDYAYGVAGFIIK